MKYTVGLSLAALLLLTCACSRETVQRTTYETLQNIQDQRCDKDLSSTCPERDRYEQYQRSRKESSVTDQ